VVNAVLLVVSEASVPSLADPARGV